MVFPFLFINPATPDHQVMGSSEGGQVDGESFDRVYPIEVEGVGGAVRKLEIGYTRLFLVLPPRALSRLDT